LVVWFKIIAVRQGFALQLQLGSPFAVHAINLAWILPHRMIKTRRVITPRQSRDGEALTQHQLSFRGLTTLLEWSDVVLQLNEQSSIKVNT
jgi:hypothetical protein